MQYFGYVVKLTVTPAQFGFVTEQNGLCDVVTGKVRIFFHIAHSVQYNAITKI
jgi:hypothetical protein